MVPEGKYFITGTDTEIGKTWVGCRLLELANKGGKRCYGLKPLAAGADETEHGLQNEDAVALMAASNVALDYDTVNPMLLTSPIAPHIAAHDEGKLLSSNRLAAYAKGAMMTNSADFIVVEGAGGWLVPLNERETMADFAKELELPVILVVGMKLGCINHALLTVEAIKASGLTLAAWVANDLGDPMPRLAENIATLEHDIPAPRIKL